MQMRQGLDTGYQLDSQHCGVSFDFPQLIPCISSPINSKIRLLFYFIGILCIKHEYIHAKSCHDLQYALYLFHGKYCISGTVQHQTVPFKKHLFLITVAFFLKMLQCPVQRTVVMSLFPAADMKMIFLFVNPDFWSVMEFHGNLHRFGNHAAFTEQKLRSLRQTVLLFLTMYKHKLHYMFLFLSFLLCPFHQPFTAPTIIPFEKYFCITGYSANIGSEANTVMVIRIPFGEIVSIACVTSAPLVAFFSCSANF